MIFPSLELAKTAKRGPMIDTAPYVMLVMRGNPLKVHKIENFFDSDFGICVISLLVMSKY